MIIQCEQCQTKFKLDDSKVADKSIKVRCARCRHVFSVVGIQNEPKVPASLELNASEFKSEKDLDQNTSTAQKSEFGIKHDSYPATDNDSNFESVNSAVSHNLEETQIDPDTFDFSVFDFGDDNVESTESEVETQSLDFEETFEKLEHSAPLPKEEFGEFDFSGDDIFGDIAPKTPENDVSDSISFIEIDGFADAIDAESGAENPISSTANQEISPENPFILNNIEFGDDLPPVSAIKESSGEFKQSPDLSFAPLVESESVPKADSTTDTFEKTATPSFQEDLPPLSITSRRRESPHRSNIFVFIGILLVVFVAFFVYWGYIKQPEEKNKTTQETRNRITVRSVDASYIKNNQSGDLLVISGEAVNEFNKPRAAIQVKGIVFGADGKEISSKSAFCGNPLTKEQLSTMPMDKIEAAMANQFGDSLANMGVAPGTAIPFVIVIPKPPAGAKDYGVEPVGSTVATAKDK